MQRALSFAFAFIIALTITRAAMADDCAGGAKAVVAFARVDPETALASAVQKQLKVTLAERDVALCEGETAKTPLATVRIEPIADRVTVTLVVKDALTNKTLAREIELGSVPEDARALVVAQAADELLRASWAELLLANAPKPAREVPIAVERAVRPAEAPAPIVPVAPRIEATAGLGVEGFGGGHAQLGPEIDLATFPWRRVGMRVRGGYRVAPSVETEHGTIDATAWTVGLGPAFGITERTGRAGVDAFAEALIAIATFDAHARAGAKGTSRTGAAVYADVGAEAWFAVDGAEREARSGGGNPRGFGGGAPKGGAPLRVVAAFAIGAPLRTTRVADGTETATALSGILVGGHLGVRGAF